MTVRGRFLAEGGGIKHASGGDKKTSQELHWQEVGNSGTVGGLTAYLRGMHKGDGLRVSLCFMM